MTTSGTKTEYRVSPVAAHMNITAGPDGNLWFTEYGSNKIERMTTSGTIGEYYTVPAESGRRGQFTCPPEQRCCGSPTTGTSKLGELSTGKCASVATWAPTTLKRSTTPTQRTQNTQHVGNTPNGRTSLPDPTRGTAGNQRAPEPAHHHSQVQHLGRAGKDHTDRRLRNTNQDHDLRRSGPAAHERNDVHRRHCAAEGHR